MFIFIILSLLLVILRLARPVYQIPLGRHLLILHRQIRADSYSTVADSCWYLFCSGIFVLIFILHRQIRADIYSRVADLCWYLLYSGIFVLIFILQRQIPADIYSTVANSRWYWFYSGIFVLIFMLQRQIPAGIYFHNSNSAARSLTFYKVLCIKHISTDSCCYLFSWF